MYGWAPSLFTETITILFNNKNLKNKETERLNAQCIMGFFGGWGLKARDQFRSYSQKDWNTKRSVERTGKDELLFLWKHWWQKLSLCALGPHRILETRVLGEVKRDPLVAQSVESACNAGDLGSIPGLGRSPGGGNSPVFLPGAFHGQRSLVGCSPWSHRVGLGWVTNTFIFLFKKG